MLILAYHRVNPEVRDGLSVAPETLRSHLVTLLDRGRVNVVLEEALGGSPGTLPANGFAITFDDGYRDNIVHAAPVLADLGLRATVYLVSGMIDSPQPFPWLDTSRGVDELDLHMTTPQLEQGLESGVFTYGSHTMTHPMLSSLGVEEAREEIAASKAELERRLGVEVTTFCYPAGDFDAETVRLVAEAGYAAAVVTPNRYIPETMHTLHRVGIYSHITARLFSVKISRMMRQAQKTGLFWDLRARGRRRRA